MRRILGPMLLAAIAAATLLAVSGAPALANHVQCGEVITQDTTLDSDLIDCPDDGIVIGADGITLDLDGHTIDGDGSSNIEPCEVGVLNGPSVASTCAPSTEVSRHDVTIRDGIVREFDAGVFITGSSHGDLRRLTVTGSRVSGLIVFESDHISIERNFLIDNRAAALASAMLLGGVTNLRIENNVLAGSAEAAIETDGIRDSQIRENLILENGRGLHLHGTRNNLVAHNRAIGNDTQGIELSDGASDNLVMDNRASGNGSAGILVFDGAHRNRVERNRVFENAQGLVDSYSGGIVVWGDASVKHNVVSRNGRGIVVCCSPDTVVEHNRVFGNDLGIAVEYSSNNLIARNRVFANSAGGISLTSHEYLPSDGNRIEGNDVNRNGGDGILITKSLSGSAGTLVSRNLAIRNEDDGIDIDEPLTTLSRNAAWGNGDLGIEAVPGVTDGGRNRAFRNGNPLQCLNVACR